MSKSLTAAEVKAAFPHRVITMEMWEIEHAIKVGGARLLANLDRGNALHYEQAYMESDWIAQPASVLCEAAVAKSLDRYYDWSAWDGSKHEQYRQTEDLAGIEVRRFRTKPMPTVRRRDVEKGVEIRPAFVDMTDPREVLVFGGAHASACWNAGEGCAPDPDNNRRFPLSFIAAVEPEFHLIETMDPEGVPSYA